jgi:transposase
MTQTTFKFLATWANPHVVKRIGRARLARWFQRQTRKAWGQRRADAVVSAAEATLALRSPTGLDYEALAADIAVEASLALELTRQIARIDERIFDLYCDADPDQILLSVPGVGKVLAGQIRGRLGDPHRFTSLAAARSFSGLVPRQHSSGLTDATGGPTKQGDACLREALFLAADHARKTDPTLAARYQRLMCDAGRHHTSALCTIATVLSPGSSPACAIARPTSCATPTAARSPPSRAERSSPSATRSPPRSAPLAEPSATPAATSAGGTSAPSKESLSAPRCRPSHRPA